MLPSLLKAHLMVAPLGNLRRPQSGQAELREDVGPHATPCHYVYLCSRAFELTAAQKAARAAYRRRA